MRTIRQMEESNQIYKRFENKSIFILTKSGFRYHTDNFKILNNYSASFIDNRGQEIFISFSEIKFIQEVIGDGS